jgi:hypothetical protein
MSEKYYIVTELELQELVAAGNSRDDEWFDQIFDACRARLLPEWAAHFTVADHYGHPEYKR